jgi:drug/metabolite transporter (DMT)-like permease
VKQQTQAYFYALLAVLLWSTVATAFKLALENMSYSQLLFYSVLTALIVIFALLVANGELAKLKEQNAKDLTKSALSGALNPFFYYLVLFKAYELLPAQEALSLNYSWAVMVVIFSIIFLKQKISAIGIGGILLSFFGLLIIATKGNLLSLDFSNPLGTVLAFGSSLIWAGFWIINLKDKRNVLVKLFLSFAAGFILIVIYLFAGGISISFGNSNGLLAAIYVGLFEMGITFILWLKALKLSENTAKVSSLIYLSPFISLNLINIILGEEILLSTIIGIILIVSGILIQKSSK